MHNIPENWRDSLPTIIAASRAVKEQRDKLPRKEFIDWAQRQPVGGLSAVHKLAALCQNPTITNPDNFPKLPVAWVTLYLLARMPPEQLTKLLANGGIDGLTRYDIAEMRGFGRPGQKAMPRGVKIKLPSGVKTLSAWLRAGVELEKQGSGIQEAAKAINMPRDTYMAGRIIVIVADRTDLSEVDHRIAMEAFHQMDTDRLVVRSLRMIEPIITKIWGNRKKRKSWIRPGKAADDQRKEVFVRAISVINDTCVNAVDIKIPFMSAEEISKAIKYIQESRQALNQLVKNLRRKAND